MSLKDKTISKIIDVEGGYVNDPSDSGGATNFGITANVARDFGYMGKMKEMDRAMAYDIYTHKYWDALRLDDICELSESIAHELADTGVNMGINRAGTFLQEALNVFNRGELDYQDIEEDGQVGPMTIACLNAYLTKRSNYGEVVMVRALNALQGAFYIDLCQRRKKDERFVFGWFANRVE